MKVLHVISGIPRRAGGPSAVLQQLLQAQAKIGYEVVVCTTNVDLPSGVLDVPTHTPQVSGRVVTWFHPIGVRFLYLSLPLGWWLYQHIDEFDLIHIHGLYRFPPTFAAMLARARGLVYIIRPHGSLDPYLHRQSRYAVWLKRLYERLFDLPNLHGASAIHFTSADEAERVKFLGLKAPGFVVPNALYWEDFATLPAKGAFRRRIGVGTDARLVLFLGRLNFKKGLDILVPAFARVAKVEKDAALVIVGPDNEGLGVKVRAWCREAGVSERVRFVDHIDPEETRQAYVDADVFALSSYTENFGMTVVEAMACGCPVVISDQVNIWPEIDEARAGYVVPLDVKAVADGILAVLQNRTESDAMGQRGRALVQQRFVWDAVVTELDQVYRSLLSNRQSSQALDIS